jgi:hypothetical protein
VYSKQGNQEYFMRFVRIAIFAFLLSAAGAFAQSSRAVITGVVADPAGAAVGNAALAAENPDTKAKYQAISTSTGNYAFPELPPGKYVISATATGFKPYTSDVVVVSTGLTVRWDVMLESQEAAKTEEVAEEEEEEEEEEEGPPEPELSKLESGQVMHSISGEELKSLPFFGFASGEGRIRNPLYVLNLTPGALMTNLEYLRIDGAPSNTQSIRIDGQDVNNGLMLSRTDLNQVGVDAVEEFSILTNSYPAEYGQAGGGIINIATKSGSNAFHGSLYNYGAHEILNAAQPYTHSRPQVRRFDYGATLGGPLSIPKLTNGRGNTYFFLNFEQFRQTNVLDRTFTVPTLAFRQGDFRKALTGRKLGTDILGRSIMENTIYNPESDRIVNGVRIRDPFGSNVISKSKIDPIAKAIQDLIPKPTDTDNSQVTDNYTMPWRSPRLDSIGSFKLDHNLANTKLSFYYGIDRDTATQSLDQGGDGFSSPVTSGKPTDVTAHTYQLNYDRMMSPLRTLHIGLGYQGTSWKQGSDYGFFNQSDELNLSGAKLNYFPYITGLLTAMGGMKDMGMNMQGEGKTVKPSANASMTWIRGNHLYKFGAEFRIESYPSRVEYPAYGSLNFSADQTGLPSTLGMNLEGGTVGFPYASFLLGLANYGDIGVVSTPRLGKHSFALYAQDSWKVSPRLTLEYGLRYDYQTYLKDSEGRIASFSPTTANPAADGLKGAMIFEGSGTGRCNCNFANVYRGAFAPRLGIAFQLNSRMTFRAGWGIMYGQTPTDNGATLHSGSTNPVYSTTFQAAGMRLSDGFPAPSAWPNRNPGQLLIGSGVSPIAIHPEAGRPPMQMQWNLGIQALLRGNVMLDISYVGSRGSHWESNGLANLNALTYDRLESFGLDIGSVDDTDTTNDTSQAADRQLLRSTLNSAVARQRGFSATPYASFPLTQTVAQSLRPFPQYGDILYRWAPLGKTWYDGVQVRVSRQFAGGFGINSGFSYQKEYALGNENVGGANALEVINGIDNDSGNKHISALSRPYVLYFAPTYTFPKFRKQKLLSKFVSNWVYTAVLQYASGLPIQTPMANSNLYSLLFQNTYANRKSGAALFTSALDGNDLDPRSQFALQPEAWTDPADGEFSTGKAYYTDYRFKRHPTEQMSLARTFRIADKVHLNVRAEFQNVFNRREMVDPYYLNAKATQVRGTDNGDKNVPKSGFGFVNFKNTTTNQRNGQVIIKLQF